MAVIEDPTTPSQKAKVNSDGQLLVTSSSRNILGVHLASTGVLTVSATAQAASPYAAHAYLLNPVGSTAKVAVRRVEFTSVPSATTAFLTTPRVCVERFSFTGTFSAGQISTAKRQSTDANPVGELRTSNTGPTITGGNIAYSFFPCVVLTGVGVAVPVMLEYEPDEEGMIVLDAGEGIGFRQVDAGTASDTRKFIINLAWEEY